MGKGDIKTRRGKIANKSYGSRRPKKGKKVVVAKKASKAKAKAKPKAAGKKAVAKNTAKKE